MLILWKAKARNADGRLRDDVPDPDGAGARHVRRPGHQGRHQRRRAQPGRLRRPGSARSPTASASTVDVAHVEGDDLLDRIDGLRPHLDQPRHRRAADGRPGQRQRLPRRLGHRRARSPRAPTSSCARGSPTPPLVVGPAAWWWGWAPTDWDRLAGAVAAGHVIECGPQTTGGNFAFFGELARPVEAARLPDRRGRRRRLVRDHQAPRHRRRGHRRHGHGAAALRDRPAGVRQPRRRHPLRHDPPRRRSAPTGCASAASRGEPAPPTAKVAINYDGGFRNRMTFVLTGLDQEAKAAWVTERPASTAWAATERLARGRRHDRRPASCRRRADGADQERSSGLLHVSVKAPDERAVGRAFSSAAIELALASSPGSSRRARPGRRRRTACTGRRSCRPSEIDQVVVLADGTRIRIDPAPTGPAAADPIEPPAVDAAPAPIDAGHAARRALRRPLRRQGRQRQRRRLGPRRRRLRLAGGQPHRRRGSASCSPRPATGRSTATSCPTCGRSTSCSSATSARASPARPRSTPRPRASASTSAPGRA